MGHPEFGWGRESKRDATKSQIELRMSWQVGDAAAHFRRLFGANLLSYVGRVVTLFSPPQSTGLLFEFGPDQREPFAKLIGARSDPPKSALSNIASQFIPKIVTPDDPGPTHPDRWWRRLASGAAIGASFRERGSDTSLHIAFNSTLCDVHVDRNGFVVEEGGYTHWNIDGLLRHLTIDLAGDKAPWLLGSFTWVGKGNRPLVQATVGPWLVVEMPGKDGADKLGVTIGVQAVARF